MNSKENEIKLPVEIDIKNENNDYNNSTMTRSNSLLDRHSEREFSPLLIDERLSMIDSEEDGLLASPPVVSQKRYCGLFWRKKHQKGRATCCSKKTCIICSIIIFIPVVSFIIFCSVYFSAASLPTQTIPVEQVALMQKNATAPRLLTFNMFMRPPGIKNNENDFKNERLDFIVQNVLPAYDIITIQEAFAYANRRIDKLLAAAFKQGFYYQVTSSRHYPWDLGGDGGLVILSRFPIQKSDRIEFARGVHSDW